MCPETMPKAMRAWQLVGPKQMALGWVPHPGRPDDDGLLLRTLACSICATDYYHWSGVLPVRRFPVVPGHEYVGEVIAVGKHLAGVVEEGADVVYWGEGDYDGMAEYRQIHPVFADRGPKQTVYFTDRGFCDARQSAACVVPDSLPTDDAPLAETSTSVLRSLHGSPPKVGDTILVLGVGPSGNIAVQACRQLFGGGRIVILDPNSERRALALGVGASDAFDPFEDTDALQRLAHDSQGAFADYVFDALPHVPVGTCGDITRDLALALLRPRGLYNLYGATGGGQVLNFWTMLAKGPYVCAGGPFDVRAFSMNDSARILAQAVRFLDRGLIDPAPLISARVAWNDEVGVQEAFQNWGVGGMMKTSINWSSAARIADLRRSA